MPRRQYTYPADLGWDTTNLIETLGSYLLAAGLILVAANLAISLRRGAPAGNDPFDGATLEWAIPSPPPPYNFAAIPTIRSPYPLWDDRPAPDLVLTEGHQTPASTVVDAELDEVLDMPSDSPWPITFAGLLALVFVFLLTGHWTTALVFAGAGAAILVAWHWGDESFPGRIALPNGWWAMAIFLCTEFALFGSGIGSYFYLRFTSPVWPQDGIAAPEPLLPIALTALLVLSCVPMALAARRGARGWVVVALLMQAGYLAAQIVSYIHDLGEFSPTDNAYGSIYFTLLGAHHAHVVVGLLLSLWLLVRRDTARIVALYWYVVAAIGVLVVATQVSA
jgi:cytochrome c oxidase subunit I+III